MPTLLQLRTRCKEESDNVGQSFVSDTEWDGYINASYGELYGLLAQSYGADYFVQTPSGGFTFTTDGINQFFSLPSDFFKLLGVDIQVASPQQWVTLKPFQFSERNSLSVFNSPVPMAGQTVRVFYIPRVTPLLVDGSTTADAIDINGWSEYIIADACIKALGKEESDVSVFAGRKSALMQRLESETNNRDAGMPDRISDVLYRRARWMQYRLNGNNLWLIGNSTPGWGPWGDWPTDDAWGWF